MAQQKLNTNYEIKHCYQHMHSWYLCISCIRWHGCSSSRVNNIILAHYEYKVVILIIVMGDCNTNELKGRTKQQLGQDSQFYLESRWRLEYLWKSKSLCLPMFLREAPFKYYDFISTYNYSASIGNISPCLCECLYVH